MYPIVKVLFRHKDGRYEIRECQCTTRMTSILPKDYGLPEYSSVVAVFHKPMWTTVFIQGVPHSG